LRTLIIVVAVFFYQLTHAQKKTIDDKACENWPTVDIPIINNDGKYVTYTIFGPDSLVFQKVDHTWRKVVENGNSGAFSYDGKFALYMKNDSLHIINLTTKKETTIPDVNSYKVANSKAGWIAYNITANDVIIRNLNSGSEKKFDGTQYQFSDDGSKLVIVSGNAIRWVNVSNQESALIYSGNKVSNIVFDNSSKKLAFIENKDSLSLWLFNEGDEKAYPLLHGSLDNQSLSFNKAGGRVFFYAKKPVQKDAPQHTKINVDIWSYEDQELQSVRQKRQQSVSFKYSIDIKSQQPIQLTQENDRIINEQNDYILVLNQPAESSEKNWNPSATPSLYLVSVITGERILLKEHMQVPYCSLSPNGKFVVYYDKSYFVYNIQTRQTINSCKDINVPLSDEENDMPEAPLPYGVGYSWLENDQAFLIYDRYDIWKIDPLGIKPPANITNGFGRKHNIVFRLVYEGNLTQRTVLLAAFNRTNKDNGFFSTQLDNIKDPVKLTMGPYIYSLPSPFPLTFFANTFTPLKAKFSTAYLVRRMSITEAPNFYFTNDFKKYIPLSNIQPQQQYNWMTSELFRWKTFDSTSAEGIIYKPENFDPHKKYPVIFSIYEKQSDELHQYIHPEFSDGTLNTAYYVSHGYLVVKPNIYYKVGKPGESAYNSVVAAAKHLCQFPWVDSTKLGIQGHSFGAYETNYLITQTHIFAAAASAAGPSDFVSNYGALLGGGFSGQYLSELGQSRLGATLWERPELYIKNSPVFYADKIQTPLLIMHNKEDGDVPWQQGVELFVHLRRLRKKVWMLQYDGHGHQLGGDEARDYSVRLAQFFDYYLKNAHPPEWMTDTSGK
jgi:dienelactone hydrolase